MFATIKIDAAAERDGHERLRGKALPDLSEAFLRANDPARWNEDREDGMAAFLRLDDEARITMVIDLLKRSENREPLNRAATAGALRSAWDSEAVAHRAGDDDLHAALLIHRPSDWASMRGIQNPPHRAASARREGGGRPPGATTPRDGDLNKIATDPRCEDVDELAGVAQSRGRREVGARGFQPVGERLLLRGIVVPGVGEVLPRIRGVRDPPFVRPNFDEVVHALQDAQQRAGDGALLPICASRRRSD